MRHWLLRHKLWICFALLLAVLGGAVYWQVRLPRLITFEELQDEFRKVASTKNITPEDVITLFGPPHKRINSSQQVVLWWKDLRRSGLNWAEAEYVVLMPPPAALERTRETHYCIYLGGPGNRYLGGWKLWKNALIDSVDLAKAFLQPAKLNDWSAYELQYPVRR
jgi:hypothetical protein